MKRRILIIGLVLALLLVAVVPISMVWGESEDSVTCTVTGESISVSLSNGSVNYGVLGAGDSKNTVSGQTLTATNDGNVAEDFSIKSDDAIGDTTWTLVSGTPGPDQFKHEWSVNSGVNWTPLTSSYAEFADNITATTGTKTFDLQITMPSSITDYSQKTIIVTVQAVTHS